MAVKPTKTPTLEVVPPSTAPVFEMPKFDPKMFDMSKFEVPAAFREAAEKFSEQVKTQYSKMKVAAEEATDLLEDTYSTSSRGVSEISLKAIDNARSNINAAFDFAREFSNVKTPAEAVELHTAYLRKQFEAAKTQATEFQALVQKVATETVAPVKEQVEKTFKSVK